MLLQAARGVVCRADVDGRVADGGTEDVNCVEGGDGLQLDGHDSAGEAVIWSQDIVRRVWEGASCAGAVDRPRLGVCLWTRTWTRFWARIGVGGRAMQGADGRAGGRTWSLVLRALLRLLMLVMRVGERE